MKNRFIALCAVVALLSTLVSCTIGAPAETPPGESESVTTTASGTAETTETDTEEEHSMQIIPDVDFKGGIQLLSQKDHAHGDRFTVLDTHDFYGGTATAPVWRLAQWDSGPCLVANRIDSASTTITDGIGRTFAYDPAENKMTFELDTSLYYQGRAAVAGDYWPHLLIEQDAFLRAGSSSYAELKRHLNCNAKGMILTFDIRLTAFDETPIEGDWVRAAQFLMYFYVKGIKTNDFCWFGLQLFDNRYDLTEHYIGYDSAKADASGAMIYSIGSKHVYKNSGRTLYQSGKPDTGGEWVHVELDLTPYLADMLAVGAKDGYFKAKSLSELNINGMNVGWETIGTFDHTMEIRNLKLESQTG